METDGGPISAAPASAIFIGLCLAVSLNGGGFPAFITFTVALLVSSSWMLIGASRITPDMRCAFCAALCVTLAVSWFSICRINSLPQLPPSIDTTGRIILSRTWGRGRALLISTEYGRFAAVPVYGSAPEGSIVKVRGALFDFKRAAKPGDFDESLYWHGKGAVKKIKLLEISQLAPPSGIYRWRNSLTELITDALPQNMSAYMLALTVGARDKALTGLHREAGTVHLLAVSGFHVGILAYFLSMLFRRGLRRIIFVSAIMWLYILLAGAPSGGVRAALMLQLYLFGLLCGRPRSAFNSVCVAGVLLLLWNPWLFFDIGWRLSMLAAIFLSAAAPLIRRSLAGAAASSMLVWLVTAPQLALSFKKVPTAGLFVNIIAVPLFALIFPAVFLLSLPALAGLPFGWEIAETGEYFLEAWGIFSEYAAAAIPWNIGYNGALKASAALILGASSAFASGFAVKRIPVAALMSAALVMAF